MPDTVEPAMSDSKAKTEQWISTLGARAKALDSIFACGGAVELAAPLSLRGPGKKHVEVVEWSGHRQNKIDRKLRDWCAPASFGDGAESRTDVRVRDGRQLYARDGQLQVEGIGDALSDILGTIHKNLCPHESAPPVAQLHSLNVYERGGHFVAHKDTPRDPEVFGTLVVCLPLRFWGGRLVVEQGSRTTFDWATELFTATASDRDGLRIRWAAFFGDVDHHIERVTGGCRATLTYELRRAPGAVSAPSTHPSAPEADFAAVLAEALADPQFAPKVGLFGIPCLHLYALPTRHSASETVGNLGEHLKGRDRLIAGALERAGLAPRVVPYLFEDSAGLSWRLRREMTADEQRVLVQRQLSGSTLAEELPIESHGDWRKRDDVTWLLPPPWAFRSRESDDGRPEPATLLVGHTEYSETDYFGNEASDSAFYTAAAILFERRPLPAQHVPAVEEGRMTAAEHLIARGRRLAELETREGELEGKGIALREILEAKFGAISPEGSSRIAAADETTLMRWIVRAAIGSSLDFVFAESQSSEPT